MFEVQNTLSFRWLVLAYSLLKSSSFINYSEVHTLSISSPTAPPSLSPLSHHAQTSPLVLCKAVTSLGRFAIKYPEGCRQNIQSQIFPTSFGVLSCSAARPFYGSKSAVGKVFQGDTQNSLSVFHGRTRSVLISESLAQSSVRYSFLIYCPIDIKSFST